MSARSLTLGGPRRPGGQGRRRPTVRESAHGGAPYEPSVYGLSRRLLRHRRDIRERADAHRAERPKAAVKSAAEGVDARTLFLTATCRAPWQRVKMALGRADAAAVNALLRVVDIEAPAGEKLAAKHRVQLVPTFIRPGGAPSRGLEHREAARDMDRRRRLSGRVPRA